MKILGIYDGSGPKAHRILYPCHGLEQFGVEITLARRINENDLPGIDIVFFNRMIDFNLYYTLKLKEKYGFKMVCDLDDHWILGKDHVLYDNYEKHGISDKIAAHIEVSDIITVTHERLCLCFLSTK